MKKTYFNLGLAAFLTAGVMMFSSCSQDELLTEESVKEETGELNADGTFTATFIPSMYEPMTRAKVEGSSTAVQSLKYLIYKDNGAGQYFYYTEGDVFGADATVGSSESHQWPYTEKIQVDLPGGNYKVAFVGNANPGLFGEGCNELLSYTADESGKWGDVRLNMPNIPFSDNNMFYMDAVEVSAKNPVAQVWLERKVCKAQLWRETVASDNGMILTTLLDSVVDHLEGDAPITDLLGGQLGDAISQVLKGLGVPLVEEILLKPILNALSEDVLRPAVVRALAPILDTQIKANHKDALLQELLNPWSMPDARSAIVTFKHVPSSLNLDGKVSGYYEDGKQYGCKIKKGEGDDHNFHYLELCGLADGKSSWTIGRIDIVREDLLGAVLDHVTEDLILPGSLIDTGSELTYSFGPNYRYKSVYGAITLNVNESYSAHEQTDNLVLDIKLGKLVNLESILDPILQEKPDKGLIEGLLSSAGELLEGNIVEAIHKLLNALNGTVSDVLDLLGLKNPLKTLCDALGDIDVHLVLPININALGVSTLELTGTWGEVTTID